VRKSVGADDGAGFDVLYIAGMTRSGSTVLERLLALDPAVGAFGELRRYWLFRNTAARPCGCGAALRDCRFWSDVERCAFGSRLADEDVDRTARDVDSALRLARLPVMLARSRWPVGPNGAAWQSDLDRVHRLYRGALDVAGARVLVDSSKVPAYAMLLTQVPGLRLHIVHLVRDPRAVTYSWLRTRDDPKWSWFDQANLLTAGQYARRWNRRNALGGGLRLVSATYQRYRYEDFVSDPNGIVDAVRRQLGLRPLVHSPVVNGRADLPVTHAVAGNPNRATDRERVPIASDDAWRSGLSAVDRRSVEKATWPLRHLYRYGPVGQGSQTAP
jgi:hypothetical protein